MLVFDLIVIFSHFHVVGPSGDAPKQRAVHLKKWIVELKNKSWSHFAQDKLGSRRKFDPKEINWRGRSGHSIVLLNILALSSPHSSVSSALFWIYPQTRWFAQDSLLPMISLHIGDQFTFANAHFAVLCVQHIAYHLSIKQKCRCFVQMQILNHQILNVVIGLVQELI